MNNYITHRPAPFWYDKPCAEILNWRGHGREAEALRDMSISISKSEYLSVNWGKIQNFKDWTDYYVNNRGEDLNEKHVTYIPSTSEDFSCT